MPKPAGSVELPEAVREIIDRIVEGYDPERIIVFGSYARGDASPDSDLDVLVIKDTNGTDGERVRAIHELLPGVRPTVQAWVRTWEEVGELLGERSLFMHTIFSEGITVHGGRHGDGGHDVADALERGNRFLAAVRSADAQTVPDAICTDCWVAAARFVNAVIIAHWVVPPDTEDLVELGQQAASLEEGLPDLTEHRTLLNQYAPPTDTPGPAADAADAERAIDAAQAIRDAVRQTLGIDDTTGDDEAADTQ